MRKRLSKICMIIGVTLLIFIVTSNGVFAAINEYYYQGTDVLENNLDKKISDSVVLESIASFVYSTASLVEYLVGIAFQGMTGQNAFPWADRVIFNSVPMLDVNFFNPSPGSLFLVEGSEGIESTPLSDIVRTTYFTILAIAIGFLAIIVAISAIKLALSSLASEKAKYKEALTKWLFSVVMLFLMHNLMSFVFFVNEKMVEVASGILKENLEQANINLLNELLTLDPGVAIDNFIEANEAVIDSMSEQKTTLTENEQVTYLLISDTTYQDAVLSKAREDAAKSVRNWFKKWGGKPQASLEALARDVDFIVSGTSYSKFTDKINIEDLENYLVDSPNLTNEEIYQSTVFQYYSSHMASLYNNEELYKTIDAWAKTIVYHYKRYHGEELDGDSNPPDLMNDLAEYFKESAYIVPVDDDGKVTGWKRSQLTIQGALLYAIFVFQSIFFFFSYIKRFFYIVVLAIMAPAIVILDFLGKTLS